MVVASLRDALQSRLLRAGPDRRRRSRVDAVLPRRRRPLDPGGVPALAVPGLDLVLGRRPRATAAARRPPGETRPRRAFAPPGGTTLGPRPLCPERSARTPRGSGRARTPERRRGLRADALRLRLDARDRVLLLRSGRESDRVLVARPVAEVIAGTLRRGDDSAPTADAARPPA